MSEAGRGRGNDGWLAGGFVLTVLAVVVASTVLLPKLLGAAGGPDSAILSALQKAQKRGFTAQVAGVSAPLESTELHWARITVAPDPEDRTRAEVVATLDFEGRLGRTRISSLGLERIAFVLRDGDWQPEQNLAPRLTRILSALEKRRQALEQGNLETLQQLAKGGEKELESLAPMLELERRRYSALHWYLRSERHEVLVSEAYRLEGDLPDRPFDEKGDRRLTLEPRGQEFVFVGGLM